MARKINDHGFWAGGASEGSPFPMGCKVKKMESVSGAGEVYGSRDLEQDIAATQALGVKKAKAQKAKADYRN